MSWREKSAERRRVYRDVGRDWRFLEEHCFPCSDLPHLDVWVCTNVKTLETRVFLVRGSEVLWSFRCPDRESWTRTYEERQVDAMRFVRRALEVKEKKLASMHASTLQWMERFPALWEYLTVESWDTGEVRERSMLCVFYEDGLFKFVLQDRENERSLWVTGADTDSCLELLDTKLANAVEGDWRAARGAKKPLRKKS